MSCPDKSLQTDVLIIGSGLAGLLLALELSISRRRIILASKVKLSDSNTRYAQGGLAAVTEAALSDTTQLHLQDTLKSGAGLTEHGVAAGIINDGGMLIDKLISLGVAFDAAKTGQPELALEGGHSRARVLHYRDSTGKAISDALIEKVRQCANVQIIENAVAVDLNVREGRCLGAHLLVNGASTCINAGETILATGGLGQVFSRTTNPAVATGDGVAMAYRAGARLADMEFVQFHPTALSLPGAPAFLISEAVRGAGAVLVDKHGQRFAGRFHQDAELATRDVVARGIMTVMREQHLDSVGLDLRPVGRSLASKFPGIVHNCRMFGIDPLKDPIPVSPAAHYFMGGILTDMKGQTTIDNLYAIGECASIGLHGANRLASNSLLEAGVMAMRLSRHLLQHAMSSPAERLTISAIPMMVPQSLSAIKSAMFELAGLQRDALGLNRLLKMLSGDQSMVM